MPLLFGLSLSKGVEGMPTTSPCFTSNETSRKAQRESGGELRVMSYELRVTLVGLADSERWVWLAAQLRPPAGHVVAQGVAADDAQAACPEHRRRVVFGEVFDGDDCMRHGFGFRDTDIFCVGTQIFSPSQKRSFASNRVYFKLGAL